MFEVKEKKAREKALEMARRLRHRGPDESGIYADASCVLVHERLAIVDPQHGKQPLIDKRSGRVLVAVGEIYNHEELAARLEKQHDFQTGSDCEILLYLYDEHGPEFLDWLDGMFTFVIHDPLTGEYFVARDHIGIMPLYMGHDDRGQLYIASEMKALDPFCSTIEEFPPGHYMTQGDLRRWYNPGWISSVPSEKVSPERLKRMFEMSVQRRLMSDVPYGVLISGGLDSSLVAAIAQKYSEERLHSFSIGLDGSPDLEHARMVAKHVGTEHHEFIFTLQEGIDAIRDVIRHLETFDVTTIRAATPMYLMARRIRSLGIKMVLSGEGADEVFGGYLYFHMAPSRDAFHEETVRKLFALSKYDCLRANKSMAAWGLETRVPFLSKDFLDYSMSFDPSEKMCAGRMEKHVLREACREYLPDTILWRQKEQFSDGVGYSWIDTLKEHAAMVVSDEMMARATERFLYGAPGTKEAYWYRQIFEQLFSCTTAALTVPVGPSIACSTAKAVEWSESFKGREDPSGRAVKVHVQAAKEL